MSLCPPLLAVLVVCAAVSACGAAKTVAMAPLAVVGTTAMAVSAATTTGFSFSSATPQTVSPQDPLTAPFVGMSRDQLLARFGKPDVGSSRSSSLVTWKSPDCLIHATLARRDGAMKALSLHALGLKTGLSAEACLAAMSKTG